MEHVTFAVIAMRRTVSAVMLVSICTVSHALDINPWKGPMPLAVLIQTDPWLMVMGSDTPRIVVYDDGQVVYQKIEKGKRPVYMHVQLVSNEFAAVTNKLAQKSNVSGLKTFYNVAPNMTDQPETMLFLALGKKVFVTTVYGLYTPFVGGSRAANLPQQIMDLHTYLTSLKFPAATPWDPSFVEVMLWDYGYAPDESIKWPKEWPGLVSSNSYLHDGNSMYSIYLPGSELPKLRDFLKTRKEKGAVEVDGRKWAVSYRYVFPGEPVWSYAFSNPSACNRILSAKVPSSDTNAHAQSTGSTARTSGNRTGSGPK